MPNTDIVQNTDTHLQKNPKPHLFYKPKQWQLLAFRLSNGINSNGIYQGLSWYHGFGEMVLTV